MAQQLNDGKQIYGVNTLFGGLANLGVDDPIALQQTSSHHWAREMTSPLTMLGSHVIAGEFVS